MYPQVQPNRLHSDRRFEIILILVVHVRLRINESFLEDVTSFLFNKVSAKSHFSHFPKWDFYRGVWLLSDLSASKKENLVANSMGLHDLGSRVFMGVSETRFPKAIESNFEWLGSEF